MVSLKNGPGCTTFNKFVIDRYFDLGLGPGLGYGEEMFVKEVNCVAGEGWGNRIEFGAKYR